MSPPPAPTAGRSWWPFRRKPLGEIAQCVVDLLADETGWRPRLLALHNERADVTVRAAGFFTLVTAGEASIRLEGRDERAVVKAYEACKKRLKARRKGEEELRMRRALSLPAGTVIPAETAEPPSLESLELVEARVRRLRQAMAARTS